MRPPPPPPGSELLIAIGVLLIAAEGLVLIFMAWNALKSMNAACVQAAPQAMLVQPGPPPSPPVDPPVTADAR